jgi:hypothetical protein
MGVGTTAEVVIDVTDIEILVMFVVFDGEGVATYISERHKITQI